MNAVDSTEVFYLVHVDNNLSSDPHYLISPKTGLVEYKFENNSGSLTGTLITASILLILLLIIMAFVAP